MSTGKAYFIRRVQKYTLQASDITSLVTTNTNIDLVISINPSGAYTSTSSTGEQTQAYIVGWIGKGFLDSITNIGTWYKSAASQAFTFAVAKGTYANLASAQSALAGTVVYYQLATPIEEEILAIGNAQGTPNGTVYVDDIKWGVDIYTTNIVVTDAISELVSITKMKTDGTELQLPVSSATIAGDGLSFTHTGLASGDAVRYTYIPQGDYFKSTTDIIYYESENDIRFPATILSQPAIGRPDFDTTNIGLLFPQNNTTEVVYIVAQLPHDRVPDSPLEPHIHCRLSGSGQPVMKIDYKLYNPNNATVPTSFTTYTMNVNTATWSSGTISNMIYGASPISAVGYDDSAIMIMKLYRNDNVYVGDLLVDEFDIHYMQLKKY